MSLAEKNSGESMRLRSGHAPRRTVGRTVWICEWNFSQSVISLPSKIHFLIFAPKDVPTGYGRDWQGENMRIIGSDQNIKNEGAIVWPGSGLFRVRRARPVFYRMLRKIITMEDFLCNRKTEKRHARAAAAYKIQPITVSERQSPKVRPPNTAVTGPPAHRREIPVKWTGALRPTST